MVGVGGRSYARRCHVCRRRKVKCDGQNPSCQRCEKAGLSCTGYERSLEFAFFDGQSVLKVERSRTSSRTTATITKVDDAQNGKDGIAGSGFVIARSSVHPNLAIGRRNSLHQALSAPQYKAGFVAVLHDRYLPDFPKPPNGQPEGLCSTWITTACGLATTKKSGMISDSLLAMSLAVVGGERHDPTISNTALSHYAKALKGLRMEIKPGPLSLSQHELDHSLVTCLACASYEIVARQSLDTFVQHLQGASALFVARGAENLHSNISRRIFYEFRVMGVTTSLMTRRYSFLASPEWLNPSWKASDPQSTNPIQTLIDSAVHLPTLMETWDRARKANKLHSTGISSQFLRNLILGALRIEKAINKWEADLRCGDDTSQLYTVRLASNTGDSPDVESPGQAYPVAYSFSNFEIAAALIYYETTQIFLLEFLIELVLYARSSEQLDLRATGLPMHRLDVRELTAKCIECADRICQSIEYFFAKDKRIVGRMVILAPFETARSLFARLSRDGKDYIGHDVNLVQKMEFCEEVARRIQAEGLLLWPGSRTT